METYKLIIKKIVNTDINFFAPDYKEDKTIKYYIKMSFCLFEKEINVFGLNINELTRI